MIRLPASFQVAIRAVLANALSVVANPTSPKSVKFGNASKKNSKTNKLVRYEGYSKIRGKVS